MVGIDYVGIFKLRADIIQRTHNIFMHSFITVFTTLWFCLLAPGTGFSYPHEPDKDFFFTQERSQLVWPEGDRNFALYDNFSYPLEPSSQLPFITPQTREFVPADIIPANLPVNDFFRKNLMVEDQIANMLYANLRMRKLLEEYYQVQERAQELFQDMEKLGTYYYDTTVDVLNEPLTLKPDTSPYSSTHTQVVEELKQWMSKSNSDKAVVRSAKSYIDNTKDLDSNREAQANGPLTLNSNTNQTYTSQEQRSATPSNPTQESGRIAGLPNFPKLSHQPDRGITKQDQRQPPPREEAEEGRAYRHTEDTSKPWIEVWAIKTIQYFKENKGEALFFLLLIFIPIFIVTSSKSR